MASWYKENIVGETHTLVAPPRNYYFPDGSMICNFNQNPAAMTALGWREWTDAELEAWHARYDPPAPERQRCTKYQLITCLTNHYPTLLTTFRTAYAANADLQFYWNTVQDLDKNYDDFKTAQAALGITDAQVSEIFSKIEGDEPVAVEV